MLPAFQIVLEQGARIRGSSLIISAFFSCCSSSSAYHLLDLFPVQGEASERNPWGHSIMSLISVQSRLEEVSLMWGYELLNTERCILGRTTRLVKEIVPDGYILYTSLGNRSTLNKMCF